LAEPVETAAATPKIAGRTKFRARLTAAIALSISSLGIYGIFWFSETISLQPEIEKAGGSVQLEVVGPQWLKDWVGRDYDWLVGTPVSLSVPPRLRVDDRWVKRLRGMTSLHTLSLNGAEITDRGMASLAPLTQLEYLDLSNTAVGDAGLEQIRGLKRLHILDLSHTRVRGPGLKHLAGMLELTSLSLDSTELDDAGLAQLPALPSLANLDLGSTKITSAGLRFLKDHPSINLLSIRNTQVDDAAIETLSARFEPYQLIIDGSNITPGGALRLGVRLAR
jgi:hypothetical protein